MGVVADLFTPSQYSMQVIAGVGGADGATPVRIRNADLKQNGVEGHVKGWCPH